jgi:hypothetical protein
MFRCIWGERARKKGKLWRDLDVGTKRERTSTGWRRRKECAGCAVRRGDDRAHVRGCGEMREREEKERGEILNEDGREIGWMKEVWKRRERIEKERGGE